MKYSIVCILALLAVLFVVCCYINKNKIIDTFTADTSLDFANLDELTSYLEKDYKNAIIKEIQDDSEAQKGDPGTPGTDGRDGSQGSQGPPGPPGATTTVSGDLVSGPPGNIGPKGDRGIGLESANYDDSSGELTLRLDTKLAGSRDLGPFMIRGEPGAAGADGADGADGASAQNIFPSIKESGNSNIGIGLFDGTDPSAKLDVSGNVKANKFMGEFQGKFHHLDNDDIDGNVERIFVDNDRRFIQGMSKTNFIQDLNLATKSFVTNKDYATQQFVTDQNYATQSELTRVENSAAASAEQAKNAEKLGGIEAGRYIKMNDSNNVVIDNAESKLCIDDVCLSKSDLEEFKSGGSSYGNVKSKGNNAYMPGDNLVWEINKKLIFSGDGRHVRKNDGGSSFSNGNSRSHNIITGDCRFTTKVRNRYAMMFGLVETKPGYPMGFNPINPYWSADDSSGYYGITYAGYYNHDSYYRYQYYTSEGDATYGSRSHDFENMNDQAGDWKSKKDHLDSKTGVAFIQNNGNKVGPYGDDHLHQANYVKINENNIPVIFVVEYIGGDIVLYYTKNGKVGQQHAHGGPSKIMIHKQGILNRTFSAGISLYLENTALADIKLEPIPYDEVNNYMGNKSVNEYNGWKAYEDSYSTKVEEDHGESRKDGPIVFI